MISKGLKRNNFAPVIDYILKDRAGVELIYSSGLKLAKRWQHFAKVMDIEAGMSKRCKKPCYHLVLAINPGDKGKISDDDFVQIGRRYLSLLDMADNQAVFVKHNDTEHPHTHIVVNRVKDGKAATLKFDYKKMMKLDRAIEQEYGLKSPFDVSESDQQENKKLQKQRAHKRAMQRRKIFLDPYLGRGQKTCSGKSCGAENASKQEYSHCKT